MVYIFDIDGTLADLTHRLHFIQQKPQDWAGFFKACIRDKEISEVADLLRVLNKDNVIFLVTGRSDEIRVETEMWLGYYSIPYEDMYMRKEGDHREDSIVKSELLDKLSLEYGHVLEREGGIAGVFEDRQQVVDMYRARGLRVYQVAKGDF